MFSTSGSSSRRCRAEAEQGVEDGPGQLVFLRRGAYRPALAEGVPGVGVQSLGDQLAPEGLLVRPGQRCVPVELASPPALAEPSQKLGPELLDEGGRGRHTGTSDGPLPFVGLPGEGGAEVVSRRARSSARVRSARTRGVRLR